MEFKIPVDKDYYYTAVLNILNTVGNMNLTKLEMDIILLMVNNNVTVLDSIFRDKIRKTLNKDKFVTNNYIKKLRDKGILLSRPNDKRYFLSKEIVESVYGDKLLIELDKV